MKTHSPVPESRDLEESLNDFFENANLAMHWVGPDGTILKANRAELEMLGYSSAEYVGHNIAEFHADPQMIGEILRCLSVGQVLTDYPAQLICKSGALREVLINSSVYRVNDEFIHTRCITRDVTELNIAIESREKLAAIVQSSDDAIVSKSLDGLISSWNSGAERIFGYTAAEMIGRHITTIIPPHLHPEEDRILSQLRQGKRVDHFETVRMRKDGSLVNISATISPIRDARGKIVGASKVARDISERIQLERQLNEAHKKLGEHAADLESIVSVRTAALRETIAELEAFSYSVSHDMRAPLRAMQGFSSILMEQYKDRLDEAGIDLLRRIQKGAHRLDQLILDVLTYSKVTKEEIRLYTVHVDALVRDIIAQYSEFQPPAVNIVIEGHLPPVIGHEAFLSQVFTNLITNGIKFVAPGITPRIRIGSDSGDPVRLWVEDNGIGIDKAHHKRVLEIFGRVHANNKYEGTGIGLAIVNKAVQRMGGTLGIERGEKSGTRFWFTLPRAE